MLDPNLSQMFSSRTQMRQRWVSEALRDVQWRKHWCSLLQAALLSQMQEPAWQQEDSLPLNWAEVTTLLGIPWASLHPQDRSELFLEHQHLSSEPRTPFRSCCWQSIPAGKGKCKGSKGNPKTSLQFQYFTRFHQQFSGIWHSFKERNLSHSFGKEKINDEVREV